MDNLAIIRRLAKRLWANERAVPTCWVWLKSLEGRLNVGSHALADEACYDKELHSHVFLPPVADVYNSLDTNQRDVDEASKLDCIPTLETVVAGTFGHDPRE